ncbi:MAG: hypothetical protein RBT11_14490 [Desulfobacterales bacterium]|nr:hypothetical protein [Desulfobacterales bacterium]
MENRLDKVLTRMKDKFQNHLITDSRHYMEVDIGKEADEMGFVDIKEKYHHVYAVIPLKEAVAGIKVRIDGRTFVNYAQFDSGIAVPGYVAKDSGLPYKTFIPKNSMICNIA